ncbi:MAG: hypothetical protein ACTHK7_05455, partial [Aureliella sp.]
MRHIIRALIAFCFCSTLNAVWPHESAGQNAVSNTLKNVHAITLSPMAEPVPALKYRFWRTPSAREPGRVNAAIARARVMYLSAPKSDSHKAQYSE